MEKNTGAGIHLRSYPAPPSAHQKLQWRHHIALLGQQHHFSLMPDQGEMQGALRAEPVAMIGQTIDGAFRRGKQVEPALAELMELASTNGIGTVGNHASLQGPAPVGGISAQEDWGRGMSQSMVIFAERLLLCLVKIAHYLNLFTIVYWVSCEWIPAPRDGGHYFNSARRASLRAAPRLAFPPSVKSV